MIDRGYLLQKVIWDKFLTYNEIIKRYINYVQLKYEKCIVFYGYREGPSTKDHEHGRRLMKVISRDVCVNLERDFSSTSQKVFLCNTRNKQCFIDLLADGLKSNGVGDADADILSSVLDMTCEGTNVTLDGADIFSILTFVHVE